MKLFTVLTFLAVASISVMGADVLGKKPQHVWGGPSSVVNSQAITRMIWAPGIDDGYVPQGLAVAGNAVLVSGYKSEDTKVDRGPCRVFRVDVQTGECTGYFDMPEECGHAGGLAVLGNGVLVIADTKRLYKVDLDKAFQAGDLKDALLGTVKLGGDLKGSLADFDGTAIFLGSSEKDEAKAKGCFLPASVFDSHDGKTVKEDAVARSFPIDAEAQGAAFDREGNLWLSFSTSKFGKLRKVDPATGKVLAEFPMVIGLEDIGFDQDGRLWAVSEAGSLRWSKWSKTFPVVFQVDVSLLK